MRRALTATLLGGTLLASAGCGSDAPNQAAPPAVKAPATPSSAPALAPPPDYSADTRRVCGKVQKIFDAQIKAFGAEMGKMITYKETKMTSDAKQATEAASKRLKSVGVNIRKETAPAHDPALKSAGEVSADKFARSAKDDAFFAQIKTNKDFDRVIERKLTEWFNPVAGFCAHNP